MRASLSDDLAWEARTEPQNWRSWKRLVVLHSENIDSGGGWPPEGKQWSLTSRVCQLLTTAGAMRNRSVREGTVSEVESLAESNGEISKKNSARANTLVLGETTT